MKFWIVWFFLAPFALVVGSTADTTIFYVSPSGNDANPGTQDAPFLTPQRAQGAVRALPSSAFKNQDVYVFFREGTYRMTAPLQLSSVDSGRNGHDVVYSSYPGEMAVLCGSIPVTGWIPTTLPLPPTPNIYQASLAPNTYFSRQLYVNGALAQRARTTDFPSGFRPNWTSNNVNSGIQFIPTLLNPLQWFDPSLWTNPQYVEAVILTQWKMMRVPIVSVTPYPGGGTPGLLVMQQPAWNNANLYFDPTGSGPGLWSFWEVTRFENALEFLSSPGQWFLDSIAGVIYYVGSDITTAEVELPVLETLVEGLGTLENPISNIRFEGLTFSFATWLSPSGANGYVSDQSAMLVVGSDNTPNTIGHNQHVVPTPGNIQFSYANNIVFSGNIFTCLGAVALEFSTGSQHNSIQNNLFSQISSSAILLGGVSSVDSRPPNQGQLTKSNLITNNLIHDVALEYNDAAGIFVGFTKKTTIDQNTIYNLSWSGIAMGWGWGLLDKGSFPGLPRAFSGEWGTFNTGTSNYGCQIINNKISNFLDYMLWDGGSIYTTGRQGPTLSKGLLIKGNVAYGKQQPRGGNTIYNDGGSRYIRVEQNVSYNNPIGSSYFGLPPNPLDPLPYPDYALLNGAPYGSDSGGCRTFGDIRFVGNYWLENGLLDLIALYNYEINVLDGFPPYNANGGFFGLCYYKVGNNTYPIDLSYKNNNPRFTLADVPTQLLLNAGVQKRPPTIPANLWILPP